MQGAHAPSAVIGFWRNSAHKFWQDIQPTPGRLSSTLRIVLASVIALILLLVWQMPFTSIGLYFIFLVGRDSPAISFRSSVFSLMTVVAAVVVELAVVIFTDNDPMARILSVAIVTFIAGMLVVATSVPALGSAWGLIYCTVIALWENHAPADTLVKNSLWLVAAFAVALGCSVAVEYIFGTRNPAKTLEQQRRMRYEALAKMFALYAEGADSKHLLEAATRVSRLALAGQSGMMELYNTIVERNLSAGNLPIGGRVRLTMLAQLMDVSAAFGLQNINNEDPEIRRRCALIAAQCRELTPGSIVQTGRDLEFRAEHTPGLLGRVEAVVHAILTMPSDLTATGARELVALPSRSVPFFIPGALKSKETVAFGLKISFCATLCYIFYHAVDWPGISTCVTTVIVAGLSSSGAIKQRIVFRLVGAAIGGLLLGLGATVFLFPYMDTITSLVILIAFISFISAWVAGGPAFNYVGLQIAFSFYVVAFEGFSAPVELAPARDRFIGILVALILMWFVFDQIWPVRTVTVMRRVFATVLRNGATLFRLEAASKSSQELLREADILRDRVGKDIAMIRTMNETVEYEFGALREEHMNTGQTILRAAVTSAALFWNQVTVLHNEQDQDFLTHPDLIEMRRKIADEMDAMAEGVLHKAKFPTSDEASLIASSILHDPRYSEYIHNTLARYEELQEFTSMLSVQPQPGAKAVKLLPQ